VRKTLPQLAEIIERCRQLFTRLGAWENVQEKTWHFPSGALIRLRYLETTKDAEQYQGHGYTWIGVDEAGNYAKPDVIDLLNGALRSAAGIPVFFRLSCNPGGAGHAWIKARYITPADPGTVNVDAHGIERVFIPSFLEDNKYLNTPEYRKRLAGAGPAWLVEAWLKGNWDVQPTGGIFDVDKINFGKVQPPLDYLIQGWDTAFTENTRNDESAGLTGGRAANGQYWLIGLEHGRWMVDVVAMKIIKARQAYPNVWRICCEGGPAGLAVDPLVRQWYSESGELACWSLVSHMHDKVAKNLAFAAAVNQGLVWVPKGASFWPDLRDQMMIFTGEDGKPDDLVDAGGVLFREFDRIMSSNERPTQPPELTPRSAADRPRPKTITVDAGPKLMWRGR
jgi:predicted phage terminase large subunit-like protein